MVLPRVLRSAGPWLVFSVLALLMSGAPAQAQTCSYASVQSRVQLNSQDPWKQTMTITQGATFRVGAFYDNTGQPVSWGAAIVEVRDPKGFVFYPGNFNFVSTPHPGNYRVRVLCGSLINTATVTVTAASCPWGSIQVSLRAHGADSWKQTLSVIQGQRFHLAGFGDSSLQVDASTLRLQVTGPNGYIVNPPVDSSFVDAPYAGTYTVYATCGSLTNTATVTAAATTVTTPAPQRPNHAGIGVAWGHQWSQIGGQSQEFLWDENNLGRIAEAGGTAVNPGFNWAPMEMTEGIIDWTYADHEVQEAEERGLQMFAFTGTTPLWALPSSTAEPHRYPPVEAKLQAFNDFFEALSARYCGRVRYYQFWNEQNGPYGWVTSADLGGGDPIALYVRWLRRWYKAMKRGCPDTVLSIGGLDCNTSTGAGGCADYLRRLYDAGAGELFDAVSLHPYGDKSNLPDSALHWAAVNQVLAELEDHGQPWKPLWLDEWGLRWSSSANPATTEPLRGQAIRHILDKLQKPKFATVFQARYLTLTDVPGSSDRWGLGDANFNTLSVTPRSSFYDFQDAVLGAGTEIPLANARLETNATARYGHISGWGPNGGWDDHAETPRPNNQNLGKISGFYSAGTSETVGQIPGARFAANRTYTFRSWVHGGIDNTGRVPYQIGYAAVDGNLGSFVPLATALVDAGNTWFESNGVSYTTGASGAEIGKQIIVRFGSGAAGGIGDIWFDSLRLTVNP